MAKFNVGIILSLGVLGLSSCGGDSGETVKIPEIKPPPEQIEYTPIADPTLDASLMTHNNLPVHDPSVIKTNDTYYVFGSHLAVGKSTDLMNWQNMNAGNNFTNDILFSPTYADALPEAIEWTGGHVGSWASDVIQLKDGKYYFYYNHCGNPASGECNMPHSYLGVAVSDNIEGPYVDQGVFLKSGTVDSVTADDLPEGIDHYVDGQMPNVIDPDVFYDKDGGLWMTYGSHFGGIWLLEMDETTAKPKLGQGYGIRLTGGGFHANEGSYVLYSPVSDYYYLFTSLAGFVADGGYNMRISRSRTPNGPYLDAAGTDMASFGGANPTPYGVKIMGGFTFVSQQGDEGDDQGYLSPGHNSAYYDVELGKHLLITHTRFPNSGESHSIRVHEMFINADGWLTASPHRYAPIEGDNIVDAGDLAGHYRFIHHGNDSNTIGHESVYVTLENNGVISGSHTGSYQLDETNPERLTLLIDGIGDFEAVMKWQWDDNFSILTPTFSGVSLNNSVVWGSKLVGDTVNDFLTKIADSISLPTEIVDGNIALPKVGTFNASIDWSSDDPEVISNTGVITPIVTGSQTVKLKATIAIGETQITRVYAVNVVEQQAAVLSAHYSFEDNLNEETGNFSSGNVIGSSIGQIGGLVAYADGVNGKALWLDGTTGIALPDSLISNYQYSIAFWVNPKAITQFTPIFFGSTGNTAWLSFLPESWDNNTMLWSGEAWFDGSAGEKILEAQWTHMAFSVDNGVVTVYLDGEEKFSGGSIADLFSDSTGNFTLGVNYWDTPFNGLVDELRVYSNAISAADVSELYNESK